MKTPRNNFMDALERQMVRLLEDKGYYLFLGGSRRFGYDQDCSDIDIMVYPKPGNDRWNLEKTLRDLGFQKNWMHYTEAMSSVWTMGNIYHICIMETEQGYLNLKIEHEMIEKVLKKEPTLTEFIKNFKKEVPGLNGAILYRLIRDTVI